MTTSSLVRRTGIATLALLLALGAGSAFARDVQLLNVSSDPTRELYRDFNAAFAKHWKQTTGDTVTVDRSDHSTAIFRIDKVAEYAKTKFPSQAVYGNIDHAGLRLITCGGTFDPAARSYDDNIVVYASLIAHDNTT